MKNRIKRSKCIVLTFKAWIIKLTGIYTILTGVNYLGSYYFLLKMNYLLPVLQVWVFAVFKHLRQGLFQQLRHDVGFYKLCKFETNVFTLKTQQQEQKHVETGRMLQCV